MRKPDGLLEYDVREMLSSAPSDDGSHRPNYLYEHRRCDRERRAHCGEPHRAGQVILQ